MLKQIYKIVSSLMLIMLLFVVSACGNKNNDSFNEDSNGETNLTITMIGSSMNDPVSLRAKQGAETHIEKLNNKHQKLTITLEWNAPEKEDVEIQKTLIQAAVNNNSDAIIISCSDSKMLDDEINKAEDAGVSVITIDRDAPYSKRTAYYGANQYEMGKNIIEKMAVLTDEEGQLVVLAGNPNAYNQQERIRGIEEVLKDYPDMRVIETIYHSETQLAASEAMLKILNQHPGLNGLILLGSWPFYDDQLLNENLPKNLNILTVNAMPSLFPYIENDIIQACIGQPLSKLGGGAIDLIVNHLYLEKDINEINTLGVIPVSIDNLGGWSRQSRAWGYEGIAKKYLTM